MAASVRIEADAFTDARIVVLAEAARYRNHYEALGRMAHLWATCTQTQQHVVSEATVRVHLGKLGPEALVASGLGERVEDGIRVRGTAGRIEWLEKMRAGASAGGKKRARRARRESGGTFAARIRSKKENKQTGQIVQPLTSARLVTEPAPSSVPSVAVAVAVAVVPAVAVQPGEVSPDPSTSPPARRPMRRVPVFTEPKGFPEFWATYPRRTGKGAARRAWLLRVNGRHDELLPLILAALAWQVDSEQWTKDRGAFIPHPATWLNQERWEDEKPAPVLTPAERWAQGLET